MTLTNANRDSSATYAFAGSKALTTTERANLYASKWYIVLGHTKIS